jgi:hypothetical protein
MASMKKTRKHSTTEDLSCKDIFTPAVNRIFEDRNASGTLNA